jgi:AcrR family transcriptional regulator
MSTVSEVTDGATDGRARRSERSRQAIVDAMLSLLEEGDLRPSAARVAERAGISERLIYHHFRDLEDLLGAVASRQAARVEDRWRPVDPDLPLPKRTDLVARQRSGLLEWLTPVRRASMLQEPYSAELREVKSALAARWRDELRAIFASELIGRTTRERRDLLAQLDAVTSWGHWDALRTGGLSKQAAQRCVGRTLYAILR